MEHFGTVQFEENILKVLICGECGTLWALEEQSFDEMNSMAGSCPMCGELVRKGGTKTMVVSEQHNCPIDCARQYGSIYVDCEEKAISEEDLAVIRPCKQHFFVPVPKVVEGVQVERCQICGVWRY